MESVKETVMNRKTEILNNKKIILKITMYICVNSCNSHIYTHTCIQIHDKLQSETILNDFLSKHFDGTSFMCSNYQCYYFETFKIVA